MKLCPRIEFGLVEQASNLALHCILLVLSHWSCFLTLLVLISIVVFDWKWRASGVIIEVVRFSDPLPVT
jgi:hypothetical protein